MTERVRIPITGQVGQYPIERTFCKLAHAFLREQDLGPIEYCAYRIDDACGLTGGLAPCLFDDPDDPQWAVIEQSVALERILAVS